MTYDDFKIERHRLNDIADDLYSPNNFPGTKAWLACSAAERDAKDFVAQYPEYLARLKADAAAAKAARLAAGPEAGSLADRIARGVD